MADPRSTPSDDEPADGEAAERSASEDRPDAGAAPEDGSGLEDGSSRDTRGTSTDGDPDRADSAEDPDLQDPTEDPDQEDDSPADRTSDGRELDEEELRRRVEEKYDFDDFGPEDMQEMTADEWDAAFESESWVTGEELLDRVADDLRRQIADRQVFAILEAVHEDDERRLLAYSDAGYAVVYPDGGVAGFGTVLRDVKPTVALCSMESYTPADPPEGGRPLPEPDAVEQGTGEFGNFMLQMVAGVHVLTGLGLIGAWVSLTLTGGDLTVIAAGVGLVFLAVGVFLFGTVANARLSDRFRAEEYRERLRTAGVEDGEMPPFVPVEDGELVDPDQRPEPATLEAVSPDDRSDGAPGDPD